MVIEDEFGDLVHAQGNLSFLMPAAPVLRQWFAGQLNTELKDKYDRRQRAVWQKMLADGEQFQVSSNLNAAILPFLAEEERFTVTVFIPRTKNKYGDRLAHLEAEEFKAGSAMESQPSVAGPLDRPEKYISKMWHVFRLRKAPSF
jgi:hypothetical protein